MIFWDLLYIGVIHIILVKQEDNCSHQTKRNAVTSALTWHRSITTSQNLSWVANCSTCICPIPLPGQILSGIYPWLCWRRANLLSVHMWSRFTGLSLKSALCLIVSLLTHPRRFSGGLAECLELVDDLQCLIGNLGCRNFKNGIIEQIHGWHLFCHLAVSAG